VDIATTGRGGFGESHGLGNVAIAFGQEASQRLRLRLFALPALALEPLGRA